MRWWSRFTYLTLSFLSQRNFSFCAFLCMNTPSKWPVSTLLKQSIHRIADKKDIQTWFQWPCSPTPWSDRCQCRRRWWAARPTAAQCSSTPGCNWHYLGSIAGQSNLAICVDINPLVVVTEEQLHPVRVGESHYCVRRHRSLWVKQSNLLIQFRNWETCQRFNVWLMSFLPVRAWEDKCRRH